MMPAALIDAEMAALVQRMTDREEPYVLATVIRTAGATSARPGDRAVVAADGEILRGWVGGGCVRSALATAAAEALAEGSPRVLSLHPSDALSDKGVAPGDEVDGVRFARNGCPSQGTLDIFVEPILPMPELVVFGSSPVAEALRIQAQGFNWTVLEGTPDDALSAVGAGTRRMIVVASQGRNDKGCLRAALGSGAEMVGFVGSRKKWAALRCELLAEGLGAEALDEVVAPAGLSIGAVTPEEIALSILAQLTQHRRQALRQASPVSPV